MGDFNGQLDFIDRFGSSVAGVGDLDSNGQPVLRFPFTIPGL